MIKTQFFIESKEKIHHEDFGHLRLLYLPLVGHKAIMVFELLFDYYHFNSYGKAFFPLAELLKMLNFKYHDFKKQCMKLEAVGLLRSFEKGDNNSFIFRLNKPLTPHNFRNNPFLYKHAIKITGEIMFERIEFHHQPQLIKKDEYREITTKYQDLFSFHDDAHDHQNTLEIALPTVKSKEDALSGLNFAQFIFYLTGQKISPSQLHLLQDFFNQGFSNQALNLITDYSFTVNGKLVNNHIKTIVNDFIAQNIKDTHNIKLELTNALTNRAHKQHKSSPSEPEGSSDQDWNDIFEALGGL